MDEQELAVVLKDCADLFYQNSEKAAYESLAGLLPRLNGQLQELTVVLGCLPDGEGTALQQKVLTDLRELVMAYQCRDGLALADLLYYDISEELSLLEELKQGAGQ